jgi:UDP-2-acetamido-3-amino-2,3-dideoxy-glucuronate N-acetyltransferase
MVQIPLFRDERGILIPLELQKEVPFPVVRLFFVSDVVKEKTRGGHAHKSCNQFLIGLAGRTTVITSDGTDQRSFVLDIGGALHLPPLIFALQKFDVGTVLAVCCDQPYDVNDYIDEIENLRHFRNFSR